MMVEPSKAHFYKLTKIPCFFLVQISRQYGNLVEIIIVMIVHEIWTTSQLCKHFFLHQSTDHLSEQWGEVTHNKHSQRNRNVHTDTNGHPRHYDKLGQSAISMKWLSHGLPSSGSANSSVSWTSSISFSVANSFLPSFKSNFSSSPFTSEVKLPSNNTKQRKTSIRILQFLFIFLQKWRETVTQRY